MAQRSHRTLQLKGRDSSPRHPPVEGTAAQWTASVELASEAAVRQESGAESRAPHPVLCAGPRVANLSSECVLSPPSEAVPF